MYAKGLAVLNIVAIYSSQAWWLGMLRWQSFTFRWVHSSCESAVVPVVLRLSIC